MALNRAAVESGLTTAEEQQHYRATHDIRTKYKEPVKRPGPNIPKDMTFGIATR
jgi:hypothetical protein